MPPRASTGRPFPSPRTEICTPRHGSRHRQRRLLGRSDRRGGLRSGRYDMLDRSRSRRTSDSAFPRHRSHRTRCTSRARPNGGRDGSSGSSGAPPPRIPEDRARCQDGTQSTLSCGR
ncbi:MAG: hypothetical protein AMJ46_07855 [Latescibacteria bacterium DG_63]|nr:MAG: hypothetical protein AMJ46_07855 [Latescibacteria bacterium DG_63]